jgi:hypothetical protein
MIVKWPKNPLKSKNWPKSSKNRKNVKNGSFLKKHQEIYYEKTEKIENYKILWKMAKFFARKIDHKSKSQFWSNEARK